MRPIYYQICILALMSRQTKPRVVVSDRVTYQLFSLFFFFLQKSSLLRFVTDITVHNSRKKSRHFRDRYKRMTLTIPGKS